MQENEKQSTLEPFCQGVNELLITGEKLVTSLGGKPDSLEGWKDLKARFSAFQMRGKDPVLIATLYGPSGSGKSGKALCGSRPYRTGIRLGIERWP